MSEKRRANFSILGGKRDEKKHPSGAAGLGTLSLSHMSSVLLTETSADVDMGLIHAKSRVERGIRFSKDRASIVESDCHRYGIVWVTVNDYPEGKGYFGVTACMMLVNPGTKQGYKNLSDHVNSMGDSLKGRVSLDALTELEKNQLLHFLQTHKPDLWENSPASVLEALT